MGPPNVCISETKFVQIASKISPPKKRNADVFLVFDSFFPGVCPLGRGTGREVLHHERHFGLPETSLFPFFQRFFVLICVSDSQIHFRCHFASSFKHSEKILNSILGFSHVWLLREFSHDLGSSKESQHHRRQEGMENTRLSSSSRQGRWSRKIQGDQPSLRSIEGPTRTTDHQPSPWGTQRSTRKKVWPILQRVRDGAKEKRQPGEKRIPGGESEERCRGSKGGMASCAIYSQQGDTWEQTQSITSSSRWPRGSRKGTCCSKGECKGRGPVLALLLSVRRCTSRRWDAGSSTSGSGCSTFCHSRSIWFSQDKAIPVAAKVSAEEEDPFWSYLLCMMGTVFGCCMNSDRQWATDLIRIQMHVKLTVHKQSQYSLVVTFKRWLLHWLNPAVIVRSKKIRSSQDWNFLKMCNSPMQKGPCFARVFVWGPISAVSPKARRFGSRVSDRVVAM